MKLWNYCNITTMEPDSRWQTCSKAARPISLPCFSPRIDPLVFECLVSCTESVLQTHHTGAVNIIACLVSRADAVADMRGKVWRVSDWGLRPLAYKIQKCSKANYVLVNVEVAGDKIGELEKRLLKDERVIRHLVTKREAAETVDYPSPVVYNERREGEEEDEDSDYEDDDEDDDEDDEDEEGEEEDEEEGDVRQTSSSSGVRAV